MSPGPDSRPPLAIIGCGRAGGTLAVLLAAGGWPLTAVWSRRSARSRTVVRRLTALGLPPPTVASRPETAARSARLLLLGVPDQALPGLARRLARAPLLEPGCVVLHLSGLAPPDVLQPLGALGCRLGSLHPLAMLPAAAPPAGLLHGAGFAIDGEPPARRAAIRLARCLGGIPFHLPAAGRAAYHLAASMVANDVVGLFALAVDAGCKAGLGEAQVRRMLAHLLAGTASSLASQPPARALTGPVVRGDDEAIRSHLMAAGDSGSPTHRLHTLLSGVLLDLARRSGRLPSAAATRVARTLATARQGKRG